MFLPENIDLAHSEKYILSIRLVPNGFSFSIHCPDDLSVFHYQETTFGTKIPYSDHIKKLIFDYSFFTQAFKATHVTVVSPHYTIIPNVFFEKNRIKELFDFNFHEIRETILCHSSETEDFHTVFGMDEEVHSFLSRSLWNPRFTHHASRLLSAFLADHAEDDRKRCIVDFHDQLITVICFSGSRLLSANTYSNSDPYDALYFIASIWEKLPLDQTSDRLLLSGNIESHTHSMETLKKLIRNVEIVKFTPIVSLPEEQKRSIPTDMLVQLCG